MMIEPPQVAGLGQDGQRGDGSYSRHRHEPTPIFIVRQRQLGLLRNTIPLAAKPEVLLEN